MQADANHKLRDFAFGDRVAIVGQGETGFVRSGSQSVKALVLQAIDEALSDAGLTRQDVDGFATEGGMMPWLVPHYDVAGALGTREYVSVMGSYYGAGIAEAHRQGAEAIMSGRASVVVVYFGANWGSGDSAIYDVLSEPGAPKAAFEKPYGYYGQPVYFGAIARRYQAEYGHDLERLLGPIAIEAHQNAANNSTAQVRRAVTAADYSASPYIAEPLRTLDCCLITDGAAATVLVDAERARSLPQRPVYLKGAAMNAVPLSMDDYFTQNPDFLRWPAAPKAMQDALRMAGRTLEDLDFLQLYDCFTMSVVMQLESLGVCGPGEAADFVADGKPISIHGALPINTHGGLLSHSYMMGMTHITEAVRQLRGQAGANQVEDATLGGIGLLAGPHYAALILGSGTG